MKNAWNTPKLTNYGSVDVLTQQVKSTGSNDGVLFDPDANGPAAPVPIGPFNPS